MGKRTPPAIVRSISDDTGAGPTMCHLAVPQYEDNTRSAPDLDVDTFQRKSTYSTDSSESLSIIETIATDFDIGATQGTLSSDSDEDLQQVEIYEDDDNNLQDNWIKPGETRSCENSQSELTPKRHTLFEDLKSFSRRLQKMMHLTPSQPIHPLPRRSLLYAAAALQPTMERKPYYCSHPELPTCNADDWQGVNLNASASMLQLNHLPSYESSLRRSASLSYFASDSCLDAAPLDLFTPTPIPSIPLPQLQHQDQVPATEQENANILQPKTAPVLCIWPSTPTPTESDSSLQTRAFDFYDPPSFKLDHVVNISNSTNHRNNNNKSSLLAPCYSVSPFAIENQQPRSKCSTRSSSDLQQQQQQQQQPQQQSPAQVVLIPTTIATIENNVNAKKFSSPVGSNRLKLTPSPSKSGISGGANADSASTSTASTVTTMVPAKELGEICRRSSDSDLSVTPKGM